MIADIVCCQNTISQHYIHFGYSLRHQTAQTISHWPGVVQNVPSVRCSAIRPEKVSVDSHSTDNGLARLDPNHRFSSPLTVHHQGLDRRSRLWSAQIPATGEFVDTSSRTCQLDADRQIRNLILLPERFSFYKGNIFYETPIVNQYSFYVFYIHFFYCVFYRTNIAYFCAI